jgi:hypothetical protein
MTSASGAIACVDSSALMKLVVPEVESMTLEVALNEYAGVFTSQIARGTLRRCGRSTRSISRPLSARTSRV